jgi:hypothetical protein
MKKLKITIALDSGAAITLVEDLIEENRSTVAVKSEQISENNHQFEISGNEKELLKLQRAFTAKGYPGNIID